jgi:hypothetical protein
VLFELLAAVEEVVRRWAGGRDGHAECVVHIGVGRRARRTGQVADVAMAVVAGEAGRLGCTDLLVLAGVLQAVGVSAG